jgi:5-methyltetrahydropteroyltriglutamate--homocysteine methyltransferase
MVVDGPVGAGWRAVLMLESYLRWAVGAFELATSGVADHPDSHPAVLLGVRRSDRSHRRSRRRRHLDRGGPLPHGGARRSQRGRVRQHVRPGVCDIHSPRIPSTAEIAESLRGALKAVPAQRLWVNPDCGLKTRTVAEATASLRNLVAAASQVRPRDRRASVALWRCAGTTAMTSRITRSNPTSPTKPTARP